MKKIIMLITIVVSVACGGYYIYSQKNKSLPLPTQTGVPSSETGGWNTFTSNLGFSFEYPKNWSCEISMGGYSPDSVDTEVGVGCTDIARKNEFDNIPNKDKLGDASYYKNDLDVTFAGYSIDEYLNDPITEKIGGTVLGGKKAYEIIIGGFDANYGIVTELNGQVLQLSFGAHSKNEVGAIEKHIISSFKFTK